MIEVYRDRLKLDVMVVNAFNQILTIQPTQLRGRRRARRAVRGDEALARPHRAAAQEGRRRRVDPTRRSRCTCASPTCSWRSSRTRPRRSRRSRRSSSSIPTTPDALAFLKQMYEKRRDWEKLIAVHQREIDKLADADIERKARRIEVAKLASEKLKKPAISIELWRQVLGRRCREPRGARRAREAVRAREGVGQARRRAASGRRRRRRRHQAVGDPGEARHPLHREGPERRQGDRGLAGAPGRRAGEPARAGRAQEALPQQKDWDELEEFYAGQGKWDEFIRVLERQAEAEDDAGARRPLEQDRRALPRSAEEGRPRAEGVREGALARRAEPRRGRGADPALREDQGRAGACAEVLLVQLEHTTDPARAPERMQRLVGAARARARATRPDALWITLQALRRETRSTSGRMETSRRLAERERRLGAAGGGLRGGAAEGDGSDEDGTLAAARHAGAAPTRRSWRTPRRPSPATRRSSRSRPRIPRPSRRSSGCTSPPGASPSCSPSTTRSWSSPRAKAEALEIRFKLAGLYEDEIKQPEKAIELYQAILKQDSEQLRGADGARSHLPAARALEGAGRRPSSRRSTLSHGQRPRSPS